MNNLSITSPKAPLIKSWFGFVLGAASVAISLFGLSKSFDLAGILSTLGFMFLVSLESNDWLEGSNKALFKVDDQSMSKPCIYLTLIATILLITSTVITFIN